MKVLKDLYGFVFGKSKPNKKRKLTPPSERPKNAYFKYHEYDLLNEGSAKGLFVGNWLLDQEKWRKYFKANKDFVMISIKNQETNTHSEKIPLKIMAGETVSSKNGNTYIHYKTTGKTNTDVFEEINKKTDLIYKIQKLHPSIGVDYGLSEYTGGMKDSGRWFPLLLMNHNIEFLESILKENEGSGEKNDSTITIDDLHKEINSELSKVLALKIDGKND